MLVGRVNTFEDCIAIGGYLLKMHIEAWRCCELFYIGGGVGLGGVCEEGVSCDLKLMFLVFHLLYFNNLQDIELFVVIEDSSR
jgi:hypothetical protein